MAINGTHTVSLKSDANSTYTSHSLDQRQALIYDDLPKPTFSLEPVHLQFNLAHKLIKLLVTNNIMVIVLPNVIYKIDLENPSLVHNFPLPGKLTYIWLSPDGTELIIQIEKELHYHLVDKTFKPLKIKRIEITAIAFTNSKTLIIGTVEGHLYLYEKSLKQVFKVDAAVRCITFTSNNSQINVFANSLYTWDCFDTTYSELHEVFKRTSPAVRTIPRTGAISSNNETYLLLNSEGDILTNDEEIQFDRIEDELSQVILTRHHIVGFQEHAIRIYNKLNNELVDEISVSEGKIRGITADYSCNTYWVYTKSSIYELVIENESISVWYDYYKLGKYSEALKLLDKDDESNIPKRNLVLIKQGYDYLQKGGFGIVSDDLTVQIKGIKALAESMEPFEKVCLMLLNHNKSEPLLIEYLLCKVKKEKHIGTIDLSTWLIELMARNNDDRFYSFIKSNHKNLNKSAVYKVLDSEKLIFYADLLEDYKFILSHYLDKKDWAQAIKTLIKLYTNGSVDPVYETATVLLVHYPKVCESWLKLDLEYEKLLSALLKRPEYAVPFLQKVTMDKNYKRSKQLNNTYLSLLLAVPDTDKQIIKFLNSTTNFDSNFILRLSIARKRFHPAVIIYIKLALYDQAMDLALDHNISEAIDYLLKEGASIKLWKKYSKYLIDHSDDLNSTLTHILNNSSLGLKDLLPLFPEDVSVQDFKNEIVNSLNEYNVRINQLSNEMNESLSISKNLKQELRDFNKKTRIGIIEPGEECAKCGELLIKENFVYFPNCHHSFHKRCVKKTNECSLCNDIDI